MIRNFLKLLFASDRKILVKADEYRVQREKRYADFEISMKSLKTDSDTTLDDEIHAAIEQFREFSGSLGIATAEEIRELRDKIDALNVIVESLHHKK